MKNGITVGLACIVLRKSFWGFSEPQYRNRVKQLRELGKRLGFKVIAPAKAFEYSREAIAAARQLNEKADLAILDVATFPEGKAAKAFADTLKLPLMLWSRNEIRHGSNIAHNSFCGGNVLASNFALQRRRVRSLYGSARSAEFRARLRTAVRLVAAAKKAAGSRIGLFGEGIVPGFFDIDISPEDRAKLKERWRIEFVPVPTKDLLRLASSYKESDISAGAAKFAGQFASIEVPREALGKQARLIRAVTEFSKKERFAAIAIRCWPEMAQLYEAWPCSTLSYLNELGIPAACEGDPGGAFDMLLAKHMSDRPSTLLDIVDWDDRKDTFSVWHCGPTAVSWAHGRKARLVHHTSAGGTPSGKPVSGLPCSVDMQFAPGPVTLFRTLGALDDEFAVQGRLIRAPERAIRGSFGVIGGPKMYGREMPVGLIRNQIMDRTIPHHYAAVRGHILT